MSKFYFSWSIKKVRKQAIHFKHLPCFWISTCTNQKYKYIVLALEYIFIFNSNFIFLLRLEKKIKLHLVTNVDELSEKQIQMPVSCTNMCFCCFRQDEVILIVWQVAVIVMYKSVSDVDLSTIFVFLCSQKTVSEKNAEVRPFFRFSTSYTLVFTLQNII